MQTEVEKRLPTKAPARPLLLLKNTPPFLKGLAWVAVAIVIVVFALSRFTYYRTSVDREWLFEQAQQSPG